MVNGRLGRSNVYSSDNERLTVGLTMFGVTTPCVNAVKERLVKEGYETLVFHATGTGGKAMESLVREGHIQVSLQNSLGVVQFRIDLYLLSHDFGFVFW
jgi:uncharacterized protein (UPF0261 family)